MLTLCLAPGRSQLRPVRLADDLSTLLRINQQLEGVIIQLYRSATEDCARKGDHDNRVFFEKLLQEEQQHHAELEAWLLDLRQQAAHEHTHN